MMVVVVVVVVAVVVEVAPVVVGEMVRREAEERRVRLVNFPCVA